MPGLAWEANALPPDTLAVLREPTSKEKGGAEKMEENRRKGSEMGRRDGGKRREMDGKVDGRAESEGKGKYFVI